MLLDEPLGVVSAMEMIKPLVLTKEPSFFALDNWRVTQSLTLNLGARYDIYTPYREASNRYVNVDASKLSTGDPAQIFIQGGTTGVKTDYRDIAPRIGFAKMFGQKTVLRGAFGVYYPADIGNYAMEQNFAQEANPPYFVNFSDMPGFGGVAYEGPSKTCTITLPFPGAPPPFQAPCTGVPVPSMTGYSLSTAFSNSNITNLYAKSPICAILITRSGTYRCSGNSAPTRYPSPMWATRDAS